MFTYISWKSCEGSEHVEPMHVHYGCVNTQLLTDKYVKKNYFTFKPMFTLFFMIELGISNM